LPTDEPMKKASKSIVLNFKMPRLYRDDLVAIEHVVKNELQARDFRLTLGDYEYSSVEEIEKDHEPTNSLRIETRYPHLTLELGNLSARLYCVDSGITSLGAVTKIEQLVRRCERPWRYFGGPNNFVPSLFLCVVFGLVCVAGLIAISNG